MRLKLLYTDESGFGLRPPAYDDDAGVDIPVDRDHLLQRGHLSFIGSGIRVAIPPGFFGLIVERSSAKKRGIHVHEGVIDAGFRGELLTICEQTESEYVEIKAGERLAQLVLIPAPGIAPELVKELPQSTRGTNGFGSSGHDILDRAPSVPHQRDPRLPRIYLGGVIDGHDVSSRVGLRLKLEAIPGADVYDPWVECARLSPEQTVKANEEQLGLCTIGVFDMRQCRDLTYGFGSPYEIQYLVYHRQVPVVLLWPWGIYEGRNIRALRSNPLCRFVFTEEEAVDAVRTASGLESRMASSTGAGA